MSRVQFLRRGKARGQAMVEFAAVMFVLITILVGIIYFTWALYTYYALGVAADAGARAAAIVGGDTPMVHDAIEETLQGFWVRGAFNYTVSPDRASYNEPIIVEVSLVDPVWLVFWTVPLRTQQSIRYSEIDNSWAP